MMNEPLTIKLKTLTPLWTGGADGKSDRLHATGIIGSLRWWYEALVRGLEGDACDPTSDERCPDQNGRRCPACEVFGCTSWSRKFRLRILDERAQLIQNAIDPNQSLTLQFIEARTMCDAEKWLLSQSTTIMATFGAMGGKTTLKPQKKSKVGDDYGLVKLEESIAHSTDRLTVTEYLHDTRWRNPQTTLPDLRWFFFVSGGFLWRRQINTLIGLSEDGKVEIGHADYQRFLRGKHGGGPNQAAISKKIFSFRATGGRIWGYARDQAMRDQIISQLRQTLESNQIIIKTGEEVLHEL